MGFNAPTPRRILLCFLVIAIAIPLSACSQREIYEYEDEYDEPEPLGVYIALGDSVSAGYGIFSLYDRHTDILFRMLEADGFVDEYINLSVSGFTTSDLLNLLLYMSGDELENFNNAKVISVNIGGNNILRPFLDYLPSGDEIGIMFNDAMEFALDARIIFSEIMEVVDESRGTISEVSEFALELREFADNFSVLDVFRIRALMNEASLVIGDALEMYENVSVIESILGDLFERFSNLELLTLMPLLTGAIPYELVEELAAGVQVFSEEFNEIITWLEINAPNAVIIVNTIYNPIPPILYGFPLNIYSTASEWIQAMNIIIYEENNGRYVVSDIYSNLSNNLGLMNFSLDFVHPNPSGHLIIAQTNYNDLRQYIGN